MADNDYTDHRLSRAEAELSVLCERVNAFAVSQAATNSKLDNLIESSRELKESVDKLKEKPAALWDKAASALIGAVAATGAALLFK